MTNRLFEIPRTVRFEATLDGVGIVVTIRRGRKLIIEQRVDHAMSEEARRAIRKFINARTRREKQWKLPSSHKTSTSMS